MNIKDVHTIGGGEFPPSAGLASCALPEAQSTVSAESAQKGVSTRYAHAATGNAEDGGRMKNTAATKCRNPEKVPRWHVLRCVYRKEKLAYEYMVANGIRAFYPTITVAKLIKGKLTFVTESRIPNVFFAYASEEQLRTFVYDNANLPYLRFYYRHVHVGCRIERHPMTVPNSQMDSLMLICAADSDSAVISFGEGDKFKKGQLVRIEEGPFKGVVGRVARWQGQQRVGIVIDNSLTVATAYVPNAFLMPLKE